MQARLAGRWFLARTIVAATVCSMLALPARAQMRDTIPSAIYYAGVEQLYRGDYGDAVRTFNRALNGGVKSLGPNGQIRWIDSICYHTMLGETLYHAGQPAAALEQFNLACSLYLQNPRWMLRVQFDVQPATAAEAARRAANIPWGSSTRQSTPANVAETYPVAQGQIDNSAAVQGGGVVMQPQLWPVNVVEIVRCTALATRRRNEILGPLGPFDSISKNLVLTLARGGAPPNHWSNAWIDLQRGFAAAGVADTAQAQQLRTARSSSRVASTIRSPASRSSSWAGWLSIQAIPTPPGSSLPRQPIRPFSTKTRASSTKHSAGHRLPTSPVEPRTSSRRSRTLPSGLAASD
jgi:hypothetical protein